MEFLFPPLDCTDEDSARTTIGEQGRVNRGTEAPENSAPLSMSPYFLAEGMAAAALPVPLLQGQVSPVPMMGVFPSLRSLY